MRALEPGGNLIAIIAVVAALCVTQPVVAQLTHTSSPLAVPDPTGYITLHSFATFREQVGGNFEWSPGGRLGIEIGPQGGAFQGRQILTAPQADATDHMHFTSILDVVVDDDGALGPNLPSAWEQHENSNGVAAAATPGGLDFFLTQGFRVIAPRTIEGKWQIPIDLPPSNLTSLEWVTVHEKYTVLRDTVRVELIITNDTNKGGTAGRSVAVGVRLFFDTTFGGAATDAQPIFISEPSAPFSDEVSFDSNPATPAPNVPDGWTAFELGRPRGTAGVVLKGTLRGGEVNVPGPASESGGPPDLVGFGPAGRMNAPFDSTPFAPIAIPLTGQDWGVELFWQVPGAPDLPPGRSRRYVTYIGLGDATSDFSPPYVLALESPLELSVVKGDDPSTPGATESFFYTADASATTPTGIMPVSAFVNNTAIVPLMNASLSVSLPPGSGIVFTDAAGNELPGTTRAVSLGTILANSEAPAPFYIRVPSGTPPGVYPVRLVGPLGKTVERPLTVPAIPTLAQDHLDPLAAITMISIPYQFQNGDVENILQSVTPLGSATASVARWDPAVTMYRFFPDPFTTTVLPGQGFWLINGALTRIDLPGPPDRSDVTTAQSFLLRLPRGWSQIGTPFTGPTTWSSTEFLINGALRTFNEAVGARLLLPTLYSYNEQRRDYDFTDDIPAMRLDPFRGYWVYTFTDIVALIQPPTPVVGRSVLAAGGGGRGLIPDKGDGDWEVELRASVGDLARGGRTLGVRQGAADGYGLEDTMSPPSPRSLQGHLGIGFVHSDWDALSGTYLRDLRSPTQASQVWDVVVTTDRADEPVVVTWPDLTEVPRDIQLTLRDVQAGAVRLMRTAGSYTFNSGPGGAQRHLQVAAVPGATGGLRVDGLAYIPGRGGNGSLEFGISQTAVVDVVILNVSGRKVRTVAAGRAIEAGRNAVAWDGRTESGAAAPDGLYIARITARTADRAQYTATHAFSRVSR